MTRGSRPWAALALGLAAAVVVGTPQVAWGQAPPPAGQPDRYALIIAGASGDPQYGELHKTWVANLTQVLRDRYKFDATHLTVLVETPGPGQDRSTADNVRAALGKFAKQLNASDLLFVMLIGHGGGEGNESKFNLIGPDLTVVEWSELLKPIPSRIAVVNSTSASFPFLAGLAAPNRIVITATNTRAQRYHTVFPDAFGKALAAEAADTDKNGRVSMLEAFTYASALVAQHYERIGQMQTETAVFDDTGDGTGRAAAGTGPDGDVAGLTFLDVVSAPTSSDPEVQKLLVRQQELTQQIDELRKRRQALPTEVFDREFETLVIELSLVSREIRRKGSDR